MVEILVKKVTAQNFAMTATLNKNYFNLLPSATITVKKRKEEHRRNPVLI
jgi:hypothetical protein